MTEGLAPIVVLSLEVSGLALALSGVLGIPIGAWLGLQQDIDFEEQKGFSDNYLLQGEDEPRVRRREC